MHRIVFLLDFDNTLLDHDAYKAALGSWVEEHAPSPGVARFWEIYEAVRRETDIVDLPEVISRFAFEAGSQALHRLLVAATWDFPFASIMNPGALEAVAQLRRIGTPVVLCDGHEAFQRHKLHVTGVAREVDHNILVYVHKEHHVRDVSALFPARKYVMIDDKPRIHIAMKRELGEAVTTVLVRHGAYASAVEPGSVPEIDIEVDSIAAFVSGFLPTLLEEAPAASV